jgi:hypothetical protein
MRIRSALRTAAPVNQKPQVVEPGQALMHLYLAFLARSGAGVKVDQKFGGG